MIGWFATTGKPIHCLLTKSDKLTRQEQTKTLAAARRTASADFPAVPITLQLFSSLKKTGMEETEQIVAGWLAANQQTGAAGQSAALPALEGTAEGEPTITPHPQPPFRGRG
jgi:GTP-binding protein